KAQFVGASLVVGDGAFHGIAGVAQIDEFHALDDAAVLDVEAGDDARLKHYSAAFARAGFFKKSQKNPYMRPEQSDDVMSATKNKSEPANFSRRFVTSWAFRRVFRNPTRPSKAYICAPSSSDS